MTRLATGPQTLAGGCLCAGVRFTYNGSLGGELGAVTVCHGAQCRKAQGYASAVAPALAAHFVVTAGKALIREFESSPGKKRAFFGACGSPLYSRLDAPKSCACAWARWMTRRRPARPGPHLCPRRPGLERTGRRAEISGAGTGAADLTFEPIDNFR